MCEFWSGFVHRSGRIFCGDGQNHDGGAPEAYGYDREYCREIEWSDDGRAHLTVRTEVGEDKSFWLSLVPESLYPTRNALLATITEGRTEFLRYVFEGGKVIAVQIAPGRTVINTSLNLGGCHINSLPENFKVSGGLYLSGCHIKELPENLEVGGWLDLSDCPIHALPASLKVGGWLNLSNCPIQALPENLEVGGGIYLVDCPIKFLPENLRVGGPLNLSNCPIKSLPENLNVDGWLNLTGCNNLPEWAQQHWVCQRDYENAKRIAVCD